MADVTFVQLISGCCFISALIIGLIMYLCGGNVKWSQLNDDGRTMLVGGYAVLLIGIITGIVAGLEHYQVIDTVMPL